jgi:hypothetical protein
MSALASLDIQAYALLAEFSETCSKFLRERLGKARSQIITWTDEVVETKKSHGPHGMLAHLRRSQQESNQTSGS